jgi:transglutaminase-like putative cysteine protease
MATTDRAARAHDTDYAQALALAGLLAGASLSLSRLYAGNQWLLPTWLTIACALGLAALLRRLGVGQLLSLLAMLAGFVVVAGILLFADTVLLVIPTRETLVAMAEATQVALREVGAQAAPVDVTREFLLLTCAGAWAVTTAADGLAFRARQPLLTLVPALGLFVFPAVIRPTSPAWYTTWFLLGAAGLLLFEGRARLATWGRWVSSASSRPQVGWRLPITRAASTGRWLALGASVVALTLPSLLPGYGQQPIMDFKEGPGSDVSVAINPFVSLQTRLRTPEEVPLFKVWAAQPTRWRLITYDRFDGTRFVPSRPPHRNLTPFQGQTAGDLDPDIQTGQLTQEVEIDGLISWWLPAATAPVAVDAGGRRVLESPGYRGLTVGRQVRKGFRYSAVSQVPNVRAQDLAGPATSEYNRPELEAYLDTGNLDREVRLLAETITQGKDTPFEKALAIQDYLRDPGVFRYNLQVPSLAEGGNQLRRFLLDIREGYCEQFAIAMAMLARQVEIPTRVAVGFTRGTPKDDYFEVTTHDAHAWPELWFPRAGWVPFEPTPRADGQVDVPLYTTETGRVPGDPSAVGAPPALAEEATDSTAPSRTAPPEPLGSQPLGGGGGQPGLLERPAVLVGLAVVLLLVLVPAVKWGRNLLARRRAGKRPRDAVAESYTEVTSWARDAGIGRRAAETPAAYARRLRSDFAEDATPLLELTGLYERAEYAAAEPGSEQAHLARRLARAARARLAGRLGWRRRLAAALSPRSLFAPRPVLRR